MELNYNEIVLLKSEIKLLKSMKKGKKVRIDDMHLRSKFFRSMVMPVTSGQDELGNFITTGEYQINNKGLTYLEYYDFKRFHSISEFIRGWITTVVAFLALILSVISIVMQYAENSFNT